MVVRQYKEELEYLEKKSPFKWEIKKGFQPNMKVSQLAVFALPRCKWYWKRFQVEGVFYVNKLLEKLMLDELQNACRPGMIGGFLPGVKQIANVAALPGIVHKSIGLPDVHSGYGFAIGSIETVKICSRVARRCLPILDGAAARIGETEPVESHWFLRPKALAFPNGQRLKFYVYVFSLRQSHACFITDENVFAHVAHQATFH